MGIDVFISHHTASSGSIVKSIAAKLEACGIHCWYSDQNIHGGDYAGKIMEALEQCRVFLLVLNRPASESPHVLNELEEITGRLAKKEDVTILPFHVADEEISPSARYYIKRHRWVEATNPPMWKRVEELAERIAILLGRQIVEEVPKGESAPVYRLVSRQPQAREVFHGREELLRQIGDTFAAGKRIMFLEGIGGIGKSELAKQYALRCAADYDHVLFVSYTTTLEKLLCDPLQIQIEGLERRQEESDEAFFARKLEILRTLVSERTLIIVDNFDTDSDSRLKELAACGARLLFTTRNAHAGYPTVKVTAIEDMGVLMGIFEENYGDSVSEEERPALEEIFRMIEYHTYTIELIAKQMEASFLTADEMLDILKNGQLQDSLSETVEGRRDRKTAFGHICSVFNTGNLTEAEKQLMMYLSLMGTEGIPASRFKEWAGLTGFEVVNGLIRRSWVRKERGQRLSLHPLVKEVIHHELKPNGINCGEFLYRLTDFTYNAWFRSYKENLAVAQNVLAVLAYFQQPDGDTYDYLIHYPNFLWQVGYFEDAIYYGHRVYEGAERTFGRASVETAVAARYLGGCYFNSGRERESIQWYQRGLECNLASGCGDSEALGMDYEKVARCYTWPYQQDFQKAEELFRIGLEIRQRMLARLEAGEKIVYRVCYEPYDAGMARDRIRQMSFEMGRMYQAMGHWQEAKAHAQMVLENLERYRPDNANSVAYAHYDIGLCEYHIAMDIGDGQREALLASAEDHLTKALEINMKMRGALAIDTIDNQEALADVYLARGRLGEASNGYMAVLSMVEDLLGSSHSRIAVVKEKMSF